MGKATIVANLGDGQYTIQPVIDTAWATARIAALQTKNTDLDTTISNLDTAVASATDNLNTADQQLQAAIAAQQDTAALEQAYHTATVTLRDLTGQRSDARLQQTANSKEIERLTNAIAAPATVNAWCADLTEDGSGTVGTIEIGREDTTPIIVPGCAAHSAEDGQIQPLLSTTPAAVFYNLAMLPGAAKWKPRYRTGTASNVDEEADTMTVTLDSAIIAGQNCNQSTTLSAVPVEYMTCNAAAFEDGDAVVVQFTGMDWSSPQVIGFVDHPKPCSTLELTGPYLVEIGSPYVATGGVEPYTYHFDSGVIDAQTGIVQSHAACPHQDGEGESCVVWVEDAHGDTAQLNCQIAMVGGFMAQKHRGARMSGRMVILSTPRLIFF